MEVPVILNIQRYSLHDGHGIRTTVFFKGCPLRCAWCHNPESHHYQRELMYYAERCSRCGCCTSICPKEAIYFEKEGIARDENRCDLCERCTEECTHSAREIAGKRYTIDELVCEVEKDRMFYEQSQGGITLSGGEVMAQAIDYIEALLKKLKKKGYHISIDTCGQAPWSHFEKVLPYINTFLYDIKHMNPEVHKKLTGADNLLILDNLKKLSEKKTVINLRLPLIKGVNDDEKNISEIIAYIKQEICTEKIFLLPYHNIGIDKYKRLGRTYEGVFFEPPSNERLEAIKRAFYENGLKDIQIGG